MAETYDVRVSIGDAALFNQRLTVPELRTTMDFTAVPEWTLLGIDGGRLDELRTLRLDVTILRSYRDGEVIAKAIGDGRPHEVEGVSDAAAGESGEAAQMSAADEETAPPRGRRSRSTT